MALVVVLATYVSGSHPESDPGSTVQLSPKRSKATIISWSDCYLHESNKSNDEHEMYIMADAVQILHLLLDGGMQNNSLLWYLMDSVYLVDVLGG